MTRWAMVADLRRCVGCQTCTAACKHANATPPGVQWRRVLDMEFGEYPDVQRAFVPVGCQHCDEPPCLDVCPTTATKKRADGIVTIDYDLCIGCAYCAVACPYQARYKTERASFAYGQRERARDAAPRRRAPGGGHQVHLLRRPHRRRPGQGLTPGVDPEATPACVNACIAEALAFGDLDDPDSNVSSCWPRTSISACTRNWAPARASTTCGTARDRRRSNAMSFGPNPWQQQSWDAPRRGQLHGRRRRQRA